MRTIPANTVAEIGCPNSTKPPLRTNANFAYPTALYVNGDVRPISKNVDKLTKNAAKHDKTSTIYPGD